MTSGGYRSVSSRDGRRNRKRRSPFTGVVSRLERIDADLPLNTNFYAGHNFSAPADRSTGTRGAQGRLRQGSTAEQGEAGALMRRSSAMNDLGDEDRGDERADFPAGDAILPNDVLLFSDAQYRRRLAAPIGGEHAHDDEHTPTPAPFNPKFETELSPGPSRCGDKFRYADELSLLLSPRRLRAQPHPADSNGCAAGNTLEEAIVQGFLELVEHPNSPQSGGYSRVRRPRSISMPSMTPTSTA